MGYPEAINKVPVQRKQKPAEKVTEATLAKEKEFKVVTGKGMVEPDTTVSALMSWLPYTGSEDRKGHDIPLEARFPKSYGRIVEQIKEASAGELQVKSDVVRAAIYLGLPILALRYKTEEWKVQHYIGRQMAEVFDSIRIHQDVESVVSALDELCRKQDEKEARDKLAEFMYAIELSSKKLKYQEVIQQELQRCRLLHLLEGTGIGDKPKRRKE